jgi:hypothetical protein
MAARSISTTWLLTGAAMVAMRMIFIAGALFIVRPFPCGKLPYIDS